MRLELEPKRRRLDRDFGPRVAGPRGRNPVEGRSRQIRDAIETLIIVTTAAGCLIHEPNRGGGLVIPNRPANASEGPVTLSLSVGEVVRRSRSADHARERWTDEDSNAPGRSVIDHSGRGMSEGSADSAHDPDEDGARMVAYWTWVAVSMVAGESDVDVTLRVEVVAERDRWDSAVADGRANDEADRSDRSTGSGGLDERKPSCESVPSVDRLHSRIARLYVRMTVPWEFRARRRNRRV